MGLNFRKRIRVLEHMSLNISKKGLSSVSLHSKFGSLNSNGLYVIRTPIPGLNWTGRIKMPKVKPEQREKAKFSNIFKALTGKGKAKKIDEKQYLSQINDCVNEAVGGGVVIKRYNFSKNFVIVEYKGEYKLGLEIKDFSNSGVVMYEDYSKEIDRIVKEVSAVIRPSK